MNKIIISISGLGYVGLPVAVAFSKNNYKTIGYDINKKRVNELLKNEDITGEVSKKDLEKSDITFTSNYEDLSKANFHIITVPTPIDKFNKPDLSLIECACAQIGKKCHISGGAGIGGVLEPLQANPVIIEDNCFIGARSEVAEGVILREGSVLSMGVLILRK